MVPNPVINPKVRLFCFPFAGGSATSYLPWAKEFLDEIELVIIQPPGRGSRLTEKPYECMSDIINELIQYAEFITSAPYIFFGHSLGSRMAFELVCQFKQNGHALPEYYIGSGSEPPHLEKTRCRIDQLSDHEFLQELKRLNGTPSSVLENKELMAVFMPVLRADFKIAFEYTAKKIKMPFPMFILNGTDDTNINDKRLTLWQELSESEIEIKYFKGDHFFINTNREEVIVAIHLVANEVLERQVALIQ